MYFSKTTPYKQIYDWVIVQLPVVYQVCKDGLDVEIKPHRHQRSNEQNRFLMAIMVALVRFHNETGFMPAGCQHWMMRTDILKEYWKARLGVASTAKLDKKAFGEFVDGIQRTLVQESSGEWEILEPDSAYLKSLIEQGGL